MATPIPKALFDFLVNDLQLSYEGDVAGLGTVQAHPVLLAEGQPRTGHATEGVFVTPANVLTVQVKPQWNQGFTLPPDKKRELEKLIEKFITEEKPNGTKIVNMGMDKTVTLNAGDSLSVKIDEHSQTVNISASKSKATPVGISYQTESSSYKLNELHNYYPNLGRIFTKNGDGKYSVSDSLDIAGTASNVGNKVLYMAGLAAYRAEKRVQNLGRFSKLEGNFLNGYYPGSFRYWRRIGNTGSKIIKGLFKYGKPISQIGIIGTVIYDGMGFVNWINNPSSNHAVHAVHPVKFTLDMGMLYIGSKTIPGAIISIVYFGIDVAYPGGWQGVAKDAYDSIIIPLLHANPNFERVISTQFIDSSIDISFPDRLIKENYTF